MPDLTPRLCCESCEREDVPLDVYDLPGDPSPWLLCGPCWAVAEESAQEFYELVFDLRRPA